MSKATKSLAITALGFGLIVAMLLLAKPANHILIARKAGNFLVDGAPNEVNEVIKNKMPGIIDDFRAGTDGPKSERTDVPVRFGQAYPVHEVDFAKLKSISAGKRKSSIASILSPRYRWEYPLINVLGQVVSSTIVEKKDGFWFFPGFERGDFEGSLTTDSVAYSANQKEIRRSLARQGISNITFIKHIRIKSLDAAFIYVDAKDSRYLIPLDSGVNRLNLKIKKAYPAGNVFDKIAKMGNGPFPAPEEADAAMRKDLTSASEDYKSGAIGDGLVPTKVGRAFQFYTVDFSNLPNQFSRSKRIASIISAPSSNYWYYPLLDATGKVVSSADVAKDNGVWSAVGYPSGVSQDVVELWANQGTVNKLLADRGIRNVKDLKLMAVNDGTWAGATLIYADTGQGEYLMPLEWGASGLSLVARKAYPAHQALNIFVAEYFKEPEPPPDDTALLRRDGYSLNIKKTPTYAKAPRVVDELVKKRWPKKTRLPGRGYQVYYCDLYKIKELGPKFGRNAVNAIISPAYVWEYPLFDKDGKFAGLDAFKKTNGAWEEAWGSPGGQMSDLVRFSTNQALVEKYLADQGIHGIRDIKHFRVEVLWLEFIYVDTAQGQFLIPFNGPLDGRLGLQEKKVYPAAEVWTRIYNLRPFPTTDRKGQGLIG